MKRDGTIGAAAFLAIAAAVGISLQTGPRPQESGSAERNSIAKRSKPSVAKDVTYEDQPGCGSLREQLEDFLEIKEMELVLPPQCYQPDDPRRNLHQDLTNKTSQLKFVIALLPDPVHTHLPVLFDQFAVAIQEGAQDEKYDFDGSWLPWDDQDPPYALFLDEKAASKERELKETQPGIILFRKTVDCGTKDVKDPTERDKQQGMQKECRDDWEKGSLSKSYRKGLVVFVVGEEATHGIHKDQFQNALEWIKVLRPKVDAVGKPLAILGPTFSGSLPSLTQLLSAPEVKDQLNLLLPPLSLTPPPTKTTDQSEQGCKAREKDRLAIYSGSVTSYDLAESFQCSVKSQAVFHSFLQNDDKSLSRFCTYIKKGQSLGYDARRIAVVSEDETAYGGFKVAHSGSGQDDSACDDNILKLYYPRDISALREAYQTKSLFDSGTAPQRSTAQSRNLPTDLADPSGRVHDSIRNYGGNQTPLTQEAFLMDLVAALREFHVRYIALRSSNPLDQLFLTNFLRRSYPDGRIVIFDSDLMFIRERGATGLSGSMTLSTYPLFPLEHRWTDQKLAGADRIFGADGSEGTYTAFRLLLNDQSLHNGTGEPSGCHVLAEGDSTIFLPPVACGTDTTPIPDYAPPFWMVPKSEWCNERNEQYNGKICRYPGPATWLSVIGVNRFWPVAALTPQAGSSEGVLQRVREMTATAFSKDGRDLEPGGTPEMPLEMKVFWLVLMGFSVFHACCCWFGSYTSKPAFRAHFASAKDLTHSSLILGGTCCVVFLAVTAAWGSGMFHIPDAGLTYSWLAVCSMLITFAFALVAVYGNIRTGWLLSKTIRSGSHFPEITDHDFKTWKRRALGALAVATGLFCIFFVVPLEWTLKPENRVLTYWRSVHLSSGVSPIVPILLILVALYLSFWFKLHGLALFGPDRPRLPQKKQLELQDAKGNPKDYLRMFSQEDAAEEIEKRVNPLNQRTVLAGLVFFVLFFSLPCVIAGGVPIRSLGSESYSVIFLLGLDLCCSLALVETWRLYEAWEELRRLLAFLDRLSLRRTLAVLHGFSWGSVWKMSGNVLEVRYKVISRQMECMNHTIASLEAFRKKTSVPDEIAGIQSSLDALANMRDAGMQFADWYSTNYTISRAGDLTSFRKFQESIAVASGALLTKLLVPEWRKEQGSLLAAPLKEEKEEATPNPPPQAKEEHIRNAEEFVCLNYLAFVQNVLGRLRTMVITIVVLFLAATVATSTYPFDPRQALSIVLIVLFVITGVAIVKVYAEMHRDATLSHVTNTKPGELGMEFWFKIVGFGFAPLIGLLTRVFPGIADFVFSWLQPGISSLK